MLWRVGTGLLRIAADLGLVTERPVKEFTSYHVPERTLRYLAHAILEREDGSRSRMMVSPEWRMYLMRPADSRPTCYACTSSSTSTTRSREVWCRSPYPRRAQQRTQRQWWRERPRGAADHEARADPRL